MGEVAETMHLSRKRVWECDGTGFLYYCIPLQVEILPSPINEMLLRDGFR